MDIEKVREFISKNSHAVLATTRRDGGVQLSPVTAVVDADGYVAISSRETAIKVKNLRRNPHATLCVFTDKFYGEWYYVEGDVEILSLPDAMEPLVDYYRRGSGEHPDWDEYRAAMQLQGKVLLRITIDDWGPVSRGGFPPRLLDG